MWRDFDGFADCSRGTSTRNRRCLGTLKRVALRDDGPALALSLACEVSSVRLSLPTQRHQVWETSVTALSRDLEDSP